jgi:hypothetical protein
MRNSGSFVPRVILSLLVLVGSLVGCTASGVPRFVKFSPDGRWLIYEDETYPKVYVRDFHNQKQYTYNGSVACIGPDDDQLVLAPQCISFPREYFARRMELLLVEFGGDPPKEIRLPALITELDNVPLHLAFDGRQTIQAVIHPYGADSSESRVHYQLSDWAAQWQPVTDGTVEIGDSPDIWQSLPDGVERGGFAIAPHSEENGLTWGPGAEEEERGDHMVRLLRSPDRRYVVCLYDDTDIWGRMTLTDTQTGQREVILNKDNAAWDIYIAVGTVLSFPLAWLLTGP